MIDNLGGRLGSFDRIEKSLSDGRGLVGLRPGALRSRLLRLARGLSTPPTRPRPSLRRDLLAILAGSRGGH